MEDNHDNELLDRLSNLSGKCASSLVTMSVPKGYNISQFIVEELGTATNVKDSHNRKSIISALKSIQDWCRDNFNKIPENGVLIFSGIERHGEDVFEIISPKMKIKSFYYECNNRFHTERFRELFRVVNGYIIFVSGEVTYIYRLENDFVKVKTISGNLIKRQSKGGQSAHRIERITEESRTNYITRIIDAIRENILRENVDNNLLPPLYAFGSDEVLGMLLTRCQRELIKVNDGGFLVFDNNTISNTARWKQYLDTKIVDDRPLTEIVKYLDTNPDMLTFNPEHKASVKSYITEEEINLKYINHPLYGRVKGLKFIGVKYYEGDLIDHEKAYALGNEEYQFDDDFEITV
jgi:hypothetical protein